MLNSIIMHQSLLFINPFFRFLTKKVISVLQNPKKQTTSPRTLHPSTHRPFCSKLFLTHFLGQNNLE